MQTFHNFSELIIGTDQVAPCVVVENDNSVDPTKPTSGVGDRKPDSHSSLQSRVGKLEGRMDGVEGRLTAVEGRLGSLEKKVDQGFAEVRQDLSEMRNILTGDTSKKSDDSLKSLPITSIPRITEKS